jgi:hypothetical protein
MKISQHSREEKKTSPQALATDNVQAHRDGQGNNATLFDMVIPRSE